MTDNELIAEFMEVPKLYDNGQTLWDTTGSNKLIYALKEHNLRYRTSWDWLMPVVEKISQTKPMNQAWYDTSSHLLHGRMDVVYNRVVEFIKWYNSTKS